jgi:hypothetical protein
MPTALEISGRVVSAKYMRAPTALNAISSCDFAPISAVRRVPGSMGVDTGLQVANPNLSSISTMY